MPNTERRVLLAGWVRLASEPRVVRRALAYAVVVGAVLIAIKHGDAPLRGQLEPLRLFRMGLTVIVPYCVATASSVQALQSIARPTPPLA